MDTVLETGISNLNDYQRNLELSDKPEKRSGKKKKKSKKQENELKNSDSHITCKADEAASSEEKKEGSVLINCCLNSKGDIVEQREGTDVELSETVSHTKSPKAKKRKKNRSKAMEACDPSGNISVTSMQNMAVDCIENNDGIAGRESMSNLLSKRESSVTGEENGSQNLGETKAKTEDGNAESSQDALGAGSDGVNGVGGERQKRKRKKKKSCESVTNMDCDSLYHSNIEGVENCDGATEGTSVQNVEITKKKKKDKKGEVDQDALGAEDFSKVEVKTKKKKKKKKKNSLDNTDAEIAGKDLAIKIEEFATEDKSAQNVENGNKKGEVDRYALGAEDVNKVEVKMKKKKKKKSLENTDGEIANNDLAIRIEDSASDGEHVQNVGSVNKKKNDKKSVVNQDALGAESASKVEVKTKKKKRKDSSDHKTDKMEEKDNVSIPGNDEEPEIDRENIEPSSSVLIPDNLTQGGSSVETRDVPRCSCEGHTKKLVVFDLNGILADIVKGPVGQHVPDGRVSYRSVFKRPFVSSFLDFCFERFDIGIWSSRHIGLDYMINNVMGHQARKLLFCFGQDICITTNFKTKENYSKPLFLKDIRRVWDRFGTCFTCGKRKYDEKNTLLVDDSPDKALCNPPHTGIFPFPYQYTNHEDSALGPEGELRKYLERLADAPNVQKFVEENPIGQTAITETHKSWEFYSKVIEAQNKASTS